MISRRCLVAYTPPEATPAYLSVYLEDDGMVSITVRSTGDGSSTGPVGCIRVSPELAAAIFGDAQSALARAVLAEPKAR